jgi:uncharacterized protein
MAQVTASVDVRALEELCRRHGIRRLAVFGSVLHNADKPGSDLDLLVEFLPGRPVGLRFFDIQAELSRLFDRPVDLATAGFLSPHFRDDVIREAQSIYEAA